MTAPDLSERSIAAWMEKLPDDVRSSLEETGGAASEGSGELRAALATAKAFEVPDVVRMHAADVQAFGRPRRMRLMAWMAGEEKVNAARVLMRLTGEDEEGETGGSDAVGILFLEDIHALARALSHRFGRQALSGASIDAIVQSAYEVESDMEFSRGGI